MSTCRKQCFSLMFMGLNLYLINLKYYLIWDFCHCGLLKCSHISYIQHKEAEQSHQEMESREFIAR